MFKLTTAGFGEQRVGKGMRMTRFIGVVMGKEVLAP